MSSKPSSKPSRKTKRSEEVEEAEVEIIELADEEAVAVAALRTLVVTFQEMWMHEVVTRPMVEMVAQMLREHAALWCGEVQNNDEDKPVPEGVTVEQVMMAIAHELQEELDVCPGWVSMPKIGSLAQTLHAHATHLETPSRLAGMGQRPGCFAFKALTSVLRQLRV